MGYIEATGAAPPLRDARIAPIYEGTNGIQAIDLVVRKLPQSDGAHVRAYIGELRAAVAALRTSNLDGLGRSAERLERAVADLEAATDALLAMQVAGGAEAALAGATPYLRLFALVSGGAFLARGAVASGARERIALCRFFAENLATETPALRETAVEGGAGLQAAARALMA
jgi:hypothetical protein